MRPARVQLLVTCLVDRFFPGTGESVVRVLERAGVAVTVPAGQTCCGQPAFNAGYEAYARLYRVCTVSAEQAMSRLLVEAEKTARDIHSRYAE